MALLDLLGRRWALRVIWELREEPVPTFRELQARCGGVSSSVLADRLRELSEAGITRHAGDGYALTAAAATSWPAWPRWKNGPPPGSHRRQAADATPRDGSPSHDAFF